jgi:hypothetical protein
MAFRPIPASAMIFRYKGVTIGGALNQNLNLTRDTIEYSNADQPNYRQFIQGPYSWAGDVEMVVYSEATTSTSGSQASLLDGFLHNMSVEDYPSLTCSVDDEARVLQGKIIVTEHNFVGGDITANHTVNVSFQGTGELVAAQTSSATP